VAHTDWVLPPQMHLHRPRQRPQKSFPLPLAQPVLEMLKVDQGLTLWTARPAEPFLATLLVPVLVLVQKAFWVRRLAPAGCLVLLSQAVAALVVTEFSVSALAVHDSSLLSHSAVDVSPSVLATHSLSVRPAVVVWSAQPAGPNADGVP
jgi:hypothetical protein